MLRRHVFGTALILLAIRSLPTMASAQVGAPSSPQLHLLAPQPGDSELVRAEKLCGFLAVMTVEGPLSPKAAHLYFQSAARICTVHAMPPDWLGAAAAHMEGEDFFRKALAEDPRLHDPETLAHVYEKLRTRVEGAPPPARESPAATDAMQLLSAPNIIRGRVIGIGGILQYSGAPSPTAALKIEITQVLQSKSANIKVGRDTYVQVLVDNKPVQGDQITHVMNGNLRLTFMGEHLTAEELKAIISNSEFFFSFSNLGASAKVWPLEDADWIGDCTSHKPCAAYPIISPDVTQRAR